MGWSVQGEDLGFDQSKDSSSIVSEERVDHGELDAGRRVEGVVRACGIVFFVVVVSMISRKQETPLS